MIGQDQLDLCNRCIDYQAAINPPVCGGHKGFTPCIPCWLAKAKCETGKEKSVDYVNRMIKEKVLVYKPGDAFKPTRRLKPEFKPMVTRRTKQPKRESLIASTRKYIVV